MFPDHTPTQLNRLSDEAFASNTLVDKLHTKVYAIFLPESVLFDEDDQKKYWNHPTVIVRKDYLDELDICVDGSLVTEANLTPQPEFSLDTGNVAPGATLTLSDSDTGATIYYSVDGSTPTTSSTKYAAPFALSTTLDAVQTVQAIAVAANQTPSAVATRVYAIKTAAPAPTISRSSTPAAGGAFSVQITLDASQPVGTIYFTQDGTDPSTVSTIYSGPISVTAPQTVKAIASGPNNSASPVAEADYK